MKLSADTEQLFARCLEMTGGDKTAAANLVLAEALFQKPQVSAPILPTPTVPADWNVMETAQHLGVSRKTVYLLCKNGELMHHRIGRRVMIQPSSVVAFKSRNDQPIASKRHRHLSV